MDTSFEQTFIKITSDCTNLKLIPKNVKPPLRCFTHVVNPHEEDFSRT
jgi:hypothetical protein